MKHYASIQIPICDRQAAGQALAPMLHSYKGRSDAIVLALPRGGVPVAYEIATALALPMDLIPVRKLGVPFHHELAMGAIASGGAYVLNPDVLKIHGIDDATLEAVTQRELQELQRREHAYRGDKPLPDLRGQQVILVDDGLATGATMRAAVRAVRGQGAARVIVAIPVAPDEAIAQLREEADDVVCPFVPDWFTAIGRWYVDFSQVSDREVIDLLQRAWHSKPCGQAEPQELTNAATSSKH